MRASASNRRTRRLALGAIAAPLLFASGCSTLSVSGPEPEPTSGHWKGRFSLTLIGPDGADTEQQSNEDRAQGRFDLRKQNRQLDLQLFSPFGQTMATAVANDDGASLTTAKGQVYQAATTGDLLEQALGWRLPVDSLPDWLSGKGLPTDNAWVQSNGWRVRVEKRLASGLPRVLAASWPLQPRSDQNRLNLFVIVNGR